MRLTSMLFPFFILCVHAGAYDDGGQMYPTSCNARDKLAQLIRAAHSRLLAVHCAKGPAETKTKRLPHTFNLVDANNIFCNGEMDVNQLHEALFAIQVGMDDGPTKVDYFDGARKMRSKIGNEIYASYKDTVCKAPDYVQAEIEKDLSRHRDLSGDYKKLFGIQLKHQDCDHEIDVQKMVVPNRLIYSLYNTVETMSEAVNETVVDMKQVFDVVKSAREGTQLWMIFKSPKIYNKPLALAAAALAQTKELEINVILVDPEQIPRDVKAVWRSMAKSTYGTVYQIPIALLSKLSPIVVDGTNADYTLVDTHTVALYQPVDVEFAIDVSIRKFMVEVTSNDIPDIKFVSPDEQTQDIVPDVGFKSVRYYTFNAPLTGKWKIVSYGGGSEEVHITISAVALFGMKSDFDRENNIRTHSISSTYPQQLAVQNEYANINPINHITRTNLNLTRSDMRLGEMKINFMSPENNLKRLRRSTRPVFLGCVLR